MGADRSDRVIRAVVAVGALLVLALAGCGNGSPDAGTAEPTTRSLPWQTSPPTMSAPVGGPPAMPSAVVTLEPEATESPERTGTPSPTDDAEAPVPTTTSPASPPDQPGSGQGQLEGEVVELVNAERTANGCSELRVDERLEAAARAHSDDMAERNYLEHTSPEGEGPAERAAEEGYQGWSGENIAMGYPTAQAVVSAWMDSSGHRANILNCESAATGVGVSESPRGRYWTQTFGRR